MKKRNVLRRIALVNLFILFAWALLLPHTVMLNALVSTPTARQDSEVVKPEFVPDEVIIGIKSTWIDADSSFTPDSLCAEYGIQALGISKSDVRPATESKHREFIFAARVPDVHNIENLIEWLKQDPRIDYAERHTILPVIPIKERHEHIPSGLRINTIEDLRQFQWALRKLQVPEGASAQTKIGIADTGINPSGILAENFFGGWDFYNDTPDFSDPFGHGTDVAGTVAGDFGALRHAQLYSLRCATPEGEISILAFSKSVDYAIEHGIKVLNCSFGSNMQPSETELRAAERARAAGIIIVAACGNSSANLDVVPDSWNVPLYNVVRVAASTLDDTLASFSNYGHGQVEICAPGDAILLQGSTPSHFIGGAGTSVAAPWITALSAMLYDSFSDWRKVIEQILGTVDRLPQFEEKIWIGGRANYAQALAGDLNPALDTVSIDKAKIKNKKKLTLNATSMPLGSPFIITPVLRVYADDTLLDFANRDEAGVYRFSVKGRFPQGTTITVLSSRGGKANWSKAQAQVMVSPKSSLSIRTAKVRVALQL